MRDSVGLEIQQAYEEKLWEIVWKGVLREKIVDVFWMPYLFWILFYV